MLSRHVLGKHRAKELHEQVRSANVKGNKRVRRVSLLGYAILVVFAILYFFLQNHVANTLNFQRASGTLNKLSSQHSQLALNEKLGSKDIDKRIGSSPNDPNAETAPDKTKPKPHQVLVLGMHHSGTSIVTKLLIEMGLFAGKPGDLLMLPGNPLKYHEYRAAVEVDKAVLKSGQLGWGPWWVGYGFQWDRIEKLGRIPVARMKARIRAVVEGMDLDAGGSSWVMKDPRMCLLADEYLQPASNPVCVIVHRSPVEIASRMLSYNRPGQSLSAMEWAEVWEEHMTNAIRACVEQDTPIVFVKHSDLTLNPLQTVQELRHQLAAIGLLGLNQLDQNDVTRILGKQFAQKHIALANKRGNRKEFESRDANELLSSRAKLVWHVLETRNIASLSLPQLKTHSWSRTQIGTTEATEHPVAREVALEKSSEEAYVTMVSSDDPGYLSGTVALAASIRKYDSNRDMVAMVSQEVNLSSTVTTLRRGGWKVKRVQKLEEPWFGKHEKCEHFNDAQKIRWGRMFSKLQLWSLPYRKVVYLDTDTLVLRRITHFFALPNPFYGERSPSHNGINAGILVVEPSKQTLHAMLEHATLHPPKQFFKRNQVGCTEQELLNQYWDGERMDRKLNSTRHADYLSKRFTSPIGREELGSPIGATIVHWLTTKCPKPWNIPVSKLGIDGVLPRYCDPEMYRKWHGVYWSIQGVGGIKLERNVVADVEHKLDASLQGDSKEM